MFQPLYFVEELESCKTPTASRPSVQFGRCLVGCPAGCPPVNWANSLCVRNRQCTCGLEHAINFLFLPAELRYLPSQELILASPSLFQPAPIFSPNSNSWRQAVWELGETGFYRPSKGEAARRRRRCPKAIGKNELGTRWSGGLAPSIAIY